MPVTGSFNTPILFLIFNRPDLQRKVLSKIREVKPKQLFVVADGPREGHSTDNKKCEEARAIIDEMVDWDCELHKNYSEKNLGCQERVSSGITWFFEHVEQGIILEDDCLPHIDFFHFTSNLLDLYKTNKNISSIGGVNWQMGMNWNSYSYYFSKYATIWGWATWSDRWSMFTKIEGIEIDDLFYKISENYNKQLASYFIRQYQKSLKIDTWDIQWQIVHLYFMLLSVIPNVPLVQNIGFVEDSTHKMIPNWRSKIESKSLDKPYLQPPKVRSNHIADWFHENMIFDQFTLVILPKRLFNKAIKTINKCMNIGW